MRDDQCMKCEPKKFKGATKFLKILTAIYLNKQKTAEVGEWHNYLNSHRRLLFKAIYGNSALHTECSHICSFVEV